MVGACGVLALMLLARNAGADGVRHVELVEADENRGVFRVRVEPGVALDGRGWLLAYDGVRDVRWCRETAIAGDVVEFRSGERVRAASQPRRAMATSWRAWVIRDGLGGTTASQWPAECTVFAGILEIGPASRSLWLEIDPSWGVSVGDTWWVRMSGQPIARLETRLIEGARAFCTVNTLVTDLTLRTGDWAALWPGPGDRARERIRSAVVFVQQQSETAMAWVAAPSGIEWPAEPRCDVYRAGRFIAHAVVESRDERFWYARPMFAADGESLRVGDDVFVQSRRDLLERRRPARIFNAERDGWLANIGEIDDVPASAKFAVWRDGRQVGQAEIRKVQRAYSIVRPTELSPPLAPGDELWLRKREASETELRAAHLTAVHGAAFVGEVADDRLGSWVGRPMALLRDGRREGVAVVVAVEGTKCIGFAIEASLPGGLQAGMELIAIGAEQER